MQILGITSFNYSDASNTAYPIAGGTFVWWTPFFGQKSNPVLDGVAA
jgi:hypothetical protein